MLGRAFGLLAAVAVLLTAAVGVLACVGARPLAMGGAFVGVADDVNATYWNPAGLVQLKGVEATWMHTTTNRDEINYQDYAAVAGPIGNNAAAGGSWIRSDMPLDEAGSIVDNQDWFWISLAAKLCPRASIGANIREMRNSIDGLDTDMAVDIGLLARITEKLSFGLLVQDANEPETTGAGDSLVWVRNWRPGLAFRPDESSLVSFEMYDAADDGGFRSGRIGYERRLKHGWAVRTGWYGLGQSDVDAFTIGVGKRDVSEPLDETKAVDLDVTAMIGDIDTILASVTFKF